jgi:hypothetical protein
MRVVNTYPDQAEVVALAKARLAALGSPTAISSAEAAMRRIWSAGSKNVIGISRDGRYVVLNLPYNGNLWLMISNPGRKDKSPGMLRMWNGHLRGVMQRYYRTESGSPITGGLETTESFASRHLIGLQNR